ncbi:MAG TPA: hypothetical protein VNU26_18235 [Mycobacteriales bacterium]|nr:hypothetical protein [Mycobacteriales bacterium]
MPSSTATSTTPPKADPAYGRTPGLRPPLPAWAPLAWFAAFAAVLAFVVIAMVRPPGPLDDADPAFQRDGLLLDGPLVPPQVVGVEFGGRPVVLLFVRQLPQPADLSEWLNAVPEGADVRIVLPQPTTTELPAPTVVDRPGNLADAVEMPQPVDGGRPVGYAVIDSRRVVRYATLDPDYLTNAFEVTTMVNAVS